MKNKKIARCQFLQFLAASPLFAGLAPGRLFAKDTPASMTGGPTGLADLLLQTVPQFEACRSQIEAAIAANDRLNC